MKQSWEVTLRRALLVGFIVAIILGGGGVGARGSAGAAYAGTITMTDWQFPDGTGFGGAASAIIVDNEINPALIDGLWGTDISARLYPDLAAEIPTRANGGITFSSGNEVMTIHLKPAQHWSDGSSITHADYILTLLLGFAPEINNTFGSDQIARVTFSGEDMIVTYKGFYASALSSGVPTPSPLEHYERAYGVRIPPALTALYNAGAAAAYFKSPAYQGSALQKLVLAWIGDPYTSPDDVFDGPYKIAEWTQDQRITLVPNPYYTALPPEPGHPRPAKIIFVAVSRNENIVLLTLAADATYSTIDKAEGFRLGDIPSLRRTKYRIVTQRALGYTFLGLNQATPALRDVRVRRALLYAVDKRTYLKAELPFLGEVARAALNQTSPIPSASPWSNESSFPRNLYDLAKARTLLAAAGYATRPGGPGTHLQLTLYSLPEPTHVRSAQILQYFWHQVGVEVKTQFPRETGPNGLYSSYADGGIVARRRFDLVQSDFFLPPDPDLNLLFFDPNQIPSATHPFGYNAGGIVDQRILDDLRRARRARTDAERRAFYDDFQTYFVHQAYWILLLTEPNIVAVKDTIGNFQPNPVGPNDWNAWQWWDRKVSG